jgi:hypothetical protein
MIDENFKKNIWNKGLPVDGYPEDKVRQDACGALIVYDDFEKNKSLFGWGIDYIVPRALLVDKGIDENLIESPQNMRPLNVANVISKGDSYPYYTAVRVAEGTTNVDVVSNKVVNSVVQEELKQLFNL